MKYRVIMADPPWRYNHRGIQGTASKHYNTLPVAEIVSLCPDSEADAALFMWATWPMLKEGIQVIEGWGFRYVTIAWVWIKSNHNGMGHFFGVGHYTRSNSEPCLLGIKGKPAVKAKDVLGLIYSPIRAHSQKPEEQYAKIERLFDGPYLEMFARRRRLGWDQMGDQLK